MPSPLSTYSLPGSLLLLCLLSGVWSGCTEPNRLFDRRSPTYTGVDFRNTITEDDTLMNPVDYLYLYNGGGVGVGDFNGDGRPDLYFTGNMVGNRLYLNQGNFQFREITEEAGVAVPNTWSTGVSVVDVNQDGRLDLYVSVGGPPSAGKNRANRLYLNQGMDSENIPHFREAAGAYGIADSRYSTHAAFFDYDRDGDLDLYVLNNSMQNGNQNAFEPRRTEGQAKNTDRLYRNNGDGTFTDVSEEANIQTEGHGLGVAISDINKDGWPDVYVANDFATNDLLYVNDGDGTFTNRIASYLKHQSYSSMGVDVADVNNDTWNDILVLDMLPSDNERRKMVPYPTNIELLERGRRYDYEPQFLQNTLQLNNEMSPKGSLHFSEIARMTGTAATDWSWAPLMADFDNDGDRDIFVSNGYGEDVTNLDFVEKQRQLLAFGTSQTQHDQLIDEMKKLSTLTLPNRFFENEENLRFADRTGTWTKRRTGISNGTAYTDLDSDGDLDLVMNNINEVATILENNATARDSANSLQVSLRGPSGNEQGIGTKLSLHDDGNTIYHDYSPYRGYQSTVGSTVHFGLGADTTADSLTVVWPDGNRQTITQLSRGEALTVRYQDAAPQSGSPTTGSDTTQPAALFREVADARGLAYQHQERSANEMRQSPLLPHRFAHEGPGIAVGDVDGNGLDDVYVGADFGNSPVLFRQTSAGQFERSAFNGDPKYEDRGALFFDADGDGDQDLYVVSGGPIRGIEGEGPRYQDRLYINQGNWSFRRAEEALPSIETAGSVVTAADYDQDGDLDLFVGGRVRPGNYPLPPKSYLLRNDSDGDQVMFTDVTTDAADGLAEVGLVTDALWTDFDADGDRDLFVVGEWMPITVFENDGGRLTEATQSAGLAETSGWWMSLASGDFDRDRETEYVAGNLGLNTRFEAAPETPLQIHAKDYDNNGDLDAIITSYSNGTRYPIHTRDEMIAQIPGLEGRVRTYQAYADASFSSLLQPDEREGAYVRKAVRLETSYLDLDGNGEFTVRSLPRRVQVAPVFGIHPGDYNGDGILDLAMVGNWYATSSKSGRADAFYGAILKGEGSGRFSYTPTTDTGFFVEGDGKGLAQVSTGDTSSLLLATQSDGQLRAFQSRKQSMLHVSVQPDDRYAILSFEDGSTRKVEFHFGGSYLSQSSRSLFVPADVSKVVIYNAMESARVEIPR